MSCEECPCTGKKSRSFGSKNAKILIITEPPTADDLNKNTIYAGRAGTVLKEAISFAGIPNKDIAIAPCVRCDVEDASTKELNQSIKQCSVFIEKLINRIKPTLIIPLGSPSLKAILNKKSIMKERGTPVYSEKYGCYVFPTVSPKYSMAGSSAEYPKKNVQDMSPKERLIFEDFKGVKHFLKHGNMEIDTSNYTEASLKDLEEIEKYPRVSIDYETVGTQVHNDSFRVLSISFTVREGESKVVILRKASLEVIAKVKDILQNKAHKIVVGRPFEDNVTKAVFGFPLKGHIFDVLTMAHLVNENSVYNYNLENVANMYSDLHNIKDLAEGQRTTLDKASDDVLIRYNGVDTDAAFRCYNKLASIIEKEPELKRYYTKFLKPVQDMYAEISYTGFPIDLDEVRVSERELEEIANSIHESIINKMPIVIKTMHKGKLKLSRSKLIKDYLFTSPFGLKLKPQKFTPKTKEPKTDEAHLKMFSNHKIVQDILRWKKASKLLTTYYSQIYNAVNTDGKIYPTTLFINTVTGRTVVLNPTIQTIPQRSEFAPYIKRLFRAPEGYKLCMRDLAQSELRIIGWLANDKNILKALREGVDLHTKTASIVNGIPISEVTKEMRQKAKAINFGFVYGMRAESFVTYARDNYGVIFTLKEATDIRDAYFSKPEGYYMLPVYHENIKRYARKYGYVKSPLGRRRNLPAINNDKDFFAMIEAERQAINAPIQSFSSDLALIAKYLFLQKLKKEGLYGEVMPFWFIHDNVVFVARDDLVDDSMQMLNDCMSTETPKYIKKHFGVSIGYPIESDGKVGQDWANMVECK